MLKVPVFNRHGELLMPCSPAKARHLLEAGKARVKSKDPFTIQLLYGSSGYKQRDVLKEYIANNPVDQSASSQKDDPLNEENKSQKDIEGAKRIKERSNKKGQGYW